MEIVTLSLLIVTITIYDEIINGKLNISSELMDKWQKKDSQETCSRK